MTYAHIAASKGCVGVIKELMKFNSVSLILCPWICLRMGE